MKLTFLYVCPMLFKLLSSVYCWTKNMFLCLIGVHVMTISISLNYVYIRGSF